MVPSNEAGSVKCTLRNVQGTFQEGTGKLIRPRGNAPAREIGVPFINAGRVLTRIIGSFGCRRVCDYLSSRTGPANLVEVFDQNHLVAFLVVNELVNEFARK